MFMLKLAIKLKKYFLNLISGDVLKKDNKFDSFQRHKIFQMPELSKTSNNGHQIA